MGQVSHDANEHSTIIIIEARKLLEFGAPSEEASSGKLCPYQTLADYGISVLSFVGNIPWPLIPSEQQISLFGQHIATLNVRDSTVNPKLAPVEIYGVLVMYVPSNFDVASQERAIHNIISINNCFIPSLEIRSVPPGFRENSKSFKK